MLSFQFQSHVHSPPYSSLPAPFFFPSFFHLFNQKRAHLLFAGDDYVQLSAPQIHDREAELAVAFRDVIIPKALELYKAATQWELEGDDEEDDEDEDDEDDEEDDEEEEDDDDDDDEDEEEEEEEEEGVGKEVCLEVVVSLFPYVLCRYLPYCCLI